ncbi:MAG: hypothetical protein ILN61_09145 [Lachnospiraceae bacterium]|nr:hypothetical protein [Lachnospiraceae bacterium]
MPKETARRNAKRRKRRRAKKKRISRSQKEMKEIFAKSLMMPKKMAKAIQEKERKRRSLRKKRSRRKRRKRFLKSRLRSFLRRGSEILLYYVYRFLQRLLF